MERRNATNDVPKIVLTPLERSHHFGRRECIATEAQKVGRSVDRRRIAPNNLIFDCRVLSRNHALMWYENGKFYIKDTKSSNGTFVNDSRLSPSSEESGPVELKSRDVVQFGVNVNVDKKVTHGCIIAQVKLYMNDIEVPGHEPPIQQALKVVKNALTRELELETKLASMQGVLNTARELATDNMMAIVKEDELLSRLEMMENQLQVYSKNASEDELKKDLIKAFEDKHKHELATKDSLRNILQEKLECVSKLNQLQRDYDKAEQECQKYKMLFDTAKQEHSQEILKLEEQLKTSEKDRKDIESKLLKEKESLTANLESLQADADFSRNQLEKAKSRLNETEEELVELKISRETDRQRRDKGDLTNSTEVPPGTEFPPGSIIPPGTSEDPMNIEGSLIPPGTEEDPTGGNSDLTSERDTQEVAEITAEERIDSLSASTSRPNQKFHSPIDRGETILASLGTNKPKYADNERLRRVEAELEMSRARVKLLEEQLGIASNIHSYSSDETKSLAKKLSDSAIAKGQIEILQQSLLEAERKIQEITSGTAPVPIAVSENVSNDVQEPEQNEATIAELKGELSEFQKNMEALQSKLKRYQQECKKMQEAKQRLENELSQANERYTLQLEETERIKSEKLQLVAESELLRKRIDELRSVTNPEDSGVEKVRSSSFPPSRHNSLDPLMKRLEEDQKHVRILTIIALVSIGVALASWFM